MRKKSTFIAMLLVASLFTVEQITSSPSGTPAPASGGPAEGGVTCFQGGCHVGSPVNVSNIITTNIPAAGYSPNTDYTITITVSGTGNKGFQLSAQKSDGTHAGSFTPGSACWVPFSDYITHTTPKFASPAVWNFTWRSPAAGTGQVSLYGAFAITRNTTRRQVVAIQENVTSSLGSELSTVKFTAFPNPASAFIHVSLPDAVAPLSIKLLSLDGREAYTLANPQASAQGEFRLSTDHVSNGVYLLQLETAAGTGFHKVLINH